MGRARWPDAGVHVARVREGPVRCEPGASRHVSPPPPRPPPLPDDLLKVARHDLLGDFTRGADPHDDRIRRHPPALRHGDNHAGAPLRKVT